MERIRPPKFVRSVKNNKTFIYRPSMRQYYCYDGDYYISFKQKDGELVVDAYKGSNYRGLHETKLEPISEEEYLNEN